MEFNPLVSEILKEHRIDVQAGLLCLLGIYHGLDIDKVVPEEIVKAINITKIVDKDYENNTIQWNVPLFIGQEIAFDWVADWIQPFGNINPERRGSPRDALSRMKDFFRKYPEYRKEDVYKARDMYLVTIKDSKYLMKSHKFIFDGIGAMKKSTLLEYCEKAKTASSESNQKGKIMT